MSRACIIASSSAPNPATDTAIIANTPWASSRRRSQISAFTIASVTHAAAIIDHAMTTTLLAGGGTQDGHALAKRAMDAATLHAACRAED